MQSFNPTMLLLIVFLIAGICNASPRYFRPAHIPGARIVEAREIETGLPGTNTTLSVTTSESASATDAAPSATDSSTPAVACLPIMMQVDYMDCGKRKGYQYDVNRCDGKPKPTPTLSPCSTTSAALSVPSDTQ